MSLNQNQISQYIKIIAEILVALTALAGLYISIESLKIIEKHRIDNIKPNILCAGGMFNFTVFENGYVTLTWKDSTINYTGNSFKKNISPSLVLYNTGKLEATNVKISFEIPKYKKKVLKYFSDNYSFAIGKYLYILKNTKEKTSEIFFIDPKQPHQLNRICDTIFTPMTDNIFYLPYYMEKQSYPIYLPSVLYKLIILSISYTHNKELHIHSPSLLLEKIPPFFMSLKYKDQEGNIYSKRYRILIKFYGYQIVDNPMKGSGAVIVEEVSP